MKHYSMLTADYLDSLEIPLVKDGKTKCEYLNIESAFDIETTSTIYNGEKIRIYVCVDVRHWLR